MTARRPATSAAAPNMPSPGASSTLNGHAAIDTHRGSAVEGQDFPQATGRSTPMPLSPAGDKAAQPAKVQSASTGTPLAGQQAGRDHVFLGTQNGHVPAADIPGHATIGTQPGHAGDDGQPAAIPPSISRVVPLLADPLLALAADVLDDLEKARISNENRLRQLTRSIEDKDGETRGFGLDEAHPDVARLAALVSMLAAAEHQAALNLARIMRHHPLGPWARGIKGVGDKQAARLLAAIGDPYIRPEITRDDGTVEPSRPRTVSELWAYTGNHTIGGAAPKRRKGQQANWSTDAKMRAYLIAESCVKHRDSPYRPVYDAARAKHAEALHCHACERCGPRGAPAQPDSPLSDGHKHARAMRAVSKAILKDLWREARAIHGTMDG